LRPGGFFVSRCGCAAGPGVAAIDRASGRPSAVIDGNRLAGSPAKRIRF